VLDIEKSLRELDGGSQELDPELQNIGMLIRRARSQQKLKQVEVSKIAGITQTTLSDIESGKGSDGPTARTLVRVCRALNMKMALLPAKQEFGFSEILTFGNETSARSTHWGEDECEYKNAYIRENAA
jgi:transcriptional regulator with XRE-family HTH domain